MNAVPVTGMKKRACEPPVRATMNTTRAARGRVMVSAFRDAPLLPKWA